MVVGCPMWWYFVSRDCLNGGVVLEWLHIEACTLRIILGAFPLGALAPWPFGTVTFANWGVLKLGPCLFGGVIGGGTWQRCLGQVWGSPASFSPTLGKVNSAVKGVGLAGGLAWGESLLIGCCSLPGSDSRAGSLLISVLPRLAAVGTVSRAEGQAVPSSPLCLSRSLSLSFPVYPPIHPSTCLLAASSPARRPPESLDHPG